VAYGGWPATKIHWRRHSGSSLTSRHRASECRPCRFSLQQQRPLLDLLRQNPEFTRHVGCAALAAMCDPANYLGQSGVMVDRVLARMAG
jgi:adenylosuccinate lyase